MVRLKEICLFIFIFIFSLFWMTHRAMAMWNEDKEELNLPRSSTFLPAKKTDSERSEKEKKKETLSVIPLFSSPSVPIKPGVYKADNMEIILSHPLKEFGTQDIVIFDVDEVLITGLDPYYFEHYSKKSSLHEKLFSRGQHIIDKFFLYMFLTKPWTCMDENLPKFVKKLQQQEVRCIANTALNPTVNPKLSIDVPTLRVQILRSFGVDFSEAFPHLSLWDFNTLDSKHIPKLPPLFKDGVIFSSETPKHISTLEFFKKVEFKPKRVLYVDDFLENSQTMFEELSSLGFECYSFFYTKKNAKSLRSYFSEEVFIRELRKLELFIEKLLNEEDVDEFFSKI